MGNVNEIVPNVMVKDIDGISSYRESWRPSIYWNENSLGVKRLDPPSAPPLQPDPTSSSQVALDGRPPSSAILGNIEPHNIDVVNYTPNTWTFSSFKTSDNLQSFYPPSSVFGRIARLEEKIWGEARQNFNSAAEKLNQLETAVGNNRDPTLHLFLRLGLLETSLGLSMSGPACDLSSTSAVRNTVHSTNVAATTQETAKSLQLPYEFRESPLGSAVNSANVFEMNQYFDYAKFAEIWPLEEPTVPLPHTTVGEDVSAKTFESPPSPIIIIDKRLDGRYACMYEGCPRTYKRHTDRARHYSSHTRKLLYECPFPQCRRVGKNGFVRKDHLKQHQVNRGHKVPKK